MAKWGQFGFQDAASPIMLQLIQFHDHIMILLTLITILIGFAFISLIFNKFYSRFTIEAQTIEIIWTILPAVTLLFLAIPSFRILYTMDEITSSFLTIKAVGHQWYWSYEYSDFNNLEFDSYMTPTPDLNPGQFRLLEVDNRIVVPINMETRFLITAADVLHSWTIPAMGVKVDAVPGRLNQVAITSSHPGVFYGQCSEICGANHSFMPISLECVNWNSFCQWVQKFSS
uniref:cytochrome c oxidase subunit II n=1 Tax=Manayunkia occidentalis TaxID=2704156 RepID=UPI00165F443A|nr:cytochrome c oxidase subunit II [Manayunkia occidentalis]QLM00893.1 cytochrome c oxidase subunit 2 [Manayunkia occidentalis]